jgi:phosphonopyruvate decarboxylase|tara:strand:+ start:240 stop:1349 length:1110 start_codon:yes stop_codon:yes gene_type:complete
MLSCKAFFELLVKDVGFFTGVPDSLLKDFCGYVADHAEKHVIAANEGNAVGIAAGYHLASGKVPLVYMQNSGQGNAVNPLLSLADPKVYGIPMLLLVGWRGEPGVADEPQHVKQGEVTSAVFDAMGIAHAVLPDTMEDAAECVEKALASAQEHSAPYAILVKKGTFESYSGKASAGSGSMTREEALRMIVDAIGDSVVVSTTGKTSREVYELREAKGQDHAHDFLTVGSMGHASSITLGIALEQKKQVYCLDGDGAFIMHMGSAAVIGAQSCKNFKHIVINNGAHDSVGGQPTAGADVALGAIAKDCGYVAIYTADDEKSLKDALSELALSEGPSFLEIRVKKGARSDLGRPTSTPADNKKAFMEFLQK